MVDQAYDVGVILAVGILGIVSIDKAVDSTFIQHCGWDNANGR